ncbi:MAG: ribosomal protein S18-alanine N-acetyltransferase [Lachnospiraceae bacterium]|nr:ribosomal protein S18-alanine N-acetyltransferase [Lachnospiraceae bacterium]
MSDIIIREARVEDAAALAQIERECFSDPWSLDSLLTSLASPLYYTRAAEADGRIEAYLIASLVLGEGELLRIAVRPGNRARGIGRALADAMIRDNPGITPWRLDVRESNYAARKLYEAIGFKPVIRRRGFYEKPREDGIMMMLEG